MVPPVQTPKIRADVRKRFGDAVVRHYRANKRPLPFRQTKDPYAIWISEVMAQQTRLAAVIPYWERWMKAFPTVDTLAGASLDDVLANWAGLGYYSRARNLHKAAQTLRDSFDGKIPHAPEEIAKLPGVGRYTAGAISSIAFDQPAPVVDGNVGRVFSRVFLLEGNIRASAQQRTLWEMAGTLLPPKWASDFNQGLMDIGATICTPTNPTCEKCPVARMCKAKRLGRQTELPLLPRKRTNPIYEIELVRISNRNGWLWAKRETSGLFGGLWELPEKQALEKARIKLKLTSREPLSTHTHKLSHRTHIYKVLDGSLLGKLPKSIPGYQSFRVAPAGKPKTLGISSAMNSLLKGL